MYLCVGGGESVSVHAHLPAYKIKGTYILVKDSLKNSDIVLFILNS